VNGNTLTIVAAVAGIVVGILTTWWFTWSSKRDGDAKQASLLGEISTLKEEISAKEEMTSTLQRDLSDVADSVAKLVTPHVEKGLQPAQYPGHGAHVETSTSPSALDVVIRASLGALLDEHGDVSVPRLLRTVTQRLPDASPSLIASALQALRQAGRLSWQGDDVMKAGVIRIHAQ
jgi:hypothetical protein